MVVVSSALAFSANSYSPSSLAVVDIKTDCARLPNVSYHDADISSQEDAESCSRQLRPDVVFHTASPNPFSPMSSLKRINVGGTQNLLKATQDVSCVKAFIYTSSAQVLHDSISDMVAADETSPVLHMPVQKSAYAHSKALADDLVLRANREKCTMLTTSLRPSGMFGEDDPSPMKPKVEAAASGRYRYQVDSGKNLFDWTYIGNAAEARIQAAYVLFEDYSKPLSSISSNRRVDGESFLIINDEPIAFWEFARSLGAAAGYPKKKKKEEDIHPCHSNNREACHGGYR